MKKSEFKLIVKECLMEILSEGIGNLNTSNINENKISKTNSPKHQKQNLTKNNNENNIKNKLIEEERKKQLLLKQKKELMLKLNKSNLHDSKNTLLNKQKQLQNNNKISSPQSSQALSKLREDHKNVMMSIFEDTAKNMGNSNLDEPRYIPDGASKEQIVVSNSSPEELFGIETANKWASLAFLEEKEENKK